MTALERAAISQRIKDARVMAGLTQEEMADLLNVRQRSVANYESIRVPWRLLAKIAEITGVTTEWLLYGREPQDTSTEDRLANLEEMVGRTVLMLEQLLDGAAPDKPGGS